jgi:hypothetical protein
VSLPASVVGHEDVQLSGGVQKVTGLSMLQVREVRGLGETEADIRAISYATLLPEDQVREWFATAIPGDVQALIGAIFRLSGLDGAATFPGPAGDDAVVQRPPSEG